jgi:hypothetical protein
MPNKPYLPRKDSELLTWLENFISQIIIHANEWDIPQQEIDALKEYLNRFESLYSITNSPLRTSIAVSQKNQARQEILTLVRRMIDFRLRNPVITDDQLVAMGLNVKDKIRTPVPPPTGHPQVYISVVDARRIKIFFRDQDSKKKAKPYGVTAAVLSYAVLNAPPAKHEDLNRVVLVTRTPYILTFTEEERAKTVYVAMRWMNKKGQTGTWSEIVSAIIP